MTMEGYKGHKPGSRKGDIHKLFDEKGEGAAYKTGEKIGLSKSTIKSWIGTWGKQPSAAPKPPTSNFDHDAWRIKVLRDAAYFSLVKTGPKGPVNNGHFDSLKAAIKVANKEGFEVIWVVNSAGRFAALHKAYWVEAAKLAPAALK